jgi:hypothetical protein
VFAVPKSMKPAAEPVLENWTKQNRRAAASSRTGGWWGDRYYKTKRNAQSWEQRKAAKPAGVQVATRDDE